VSQVISCGACGFTGSLSEFLPNMTSYVNAIRCPDCRSTKNAFNSAHAILVSQVMAGKREGPVTSEQALALMVERAKSGLS
jgi:hypothetical protein